MLLVLSPSKTLNYSTHSPLFAATTPELLEESKKLVKILRRYDADQLSDLMGISEKLALLNVERFHQFSLPFTPANARPALLAFKGDVYAPMKVERYGKEDFAYAQKHVRILSGLYGVLRPLDLMQPYRLEMGTPLKTSAGRDLYEFWGDRITDSLNDALGRDGTLINLASAEYFKAVRPRKLKGRLVHIVFKEKHKGGLKIIGLFAKKARGMMADHIIRHRLTGAEGLKDFREGGYRFTPSLSDSKSWVFVR